MYLCSDENGSDCQSKHKRSSHEKGNGFGADLHYFFQSHMLNSVVIDCNE